MAMIILRRYLPFIIIPLSIAAALMFAGGCSSTTSTSPSSDQSSVTMQSQLTASDFSSLISNNSSGGRDAKLDGAFSSIVVTRVQLFVSDLKLHSDKDDLAKDDHDGTIKTGPFVAVFDSSGSHIVTNTLIPAGTYDRVKLEIHHPDEHNAADAALLASYPDFTSGNQTYTVVIDGYTVASTGLRSYFRIRSPASQNITIKLEDNLLADQDSMLFNGGSSVVLALEFDPRIVFHLSGGLTGNLFDPHDATHQGDIDGHIALALRMVKIS